MDSRYNKSLLNRVCNDNLLLFFENMQRDFYRFIWADNQDEFDFCKSILISRINHIFQYKEKLLKEYLNSLEWRAKHESKSVDDC